MDRLIEYCHKFLTSDQVKAWLKEQWERELKAYNYDTRVRELKAVVEQLNKKTEEIQHKVDEEELRYGREILADVKRWIENVEELMLDYENFTKDPYNDLAVFDLSKSGGYLPKPGVRYCQSREAYDITRRVNALLQTAATFDDTFSYWPGPPSMAALFSNFGYESFTSREETIRNVNEALEDPSVRMIGLHGLSGVGKTTLVKEVVKIALKAKMFDVVAMASATRNPDIRKIQGQIADMLGVTLDAESDIARAARIQKILKSEKKSTLIILDDLWEKLDLNMLGIPYDMDNDDVPKNVKGKSHTAGGLKNDKEEKSTRPQNTTELKLAYGASKDKRKIKSTRVRSTMESKQYRNASENGEKTEKTLSQYKGYKILMISESRQVLSRQMEGKASTIFVVEVLTEEESEKLFKKMAGISDKNSKFEKLVVPIANKCNGLPMSIITTARALKNHSLSVWENIHRTTEGQNIAGTPEFSTKLSYDHLEDDELKYTFLLCARMGRDALIMDLVKYCIGLGFLQGIYTVRETRNKVYALVAKLKESGLLSDSYSRDQFTMQDIVRNAALSIAYKENQSFTMIKGKIDEWPKKFKSYESISFNHCDFLESFPERVYYSRLRVFEVINNAPSLTIPKNFFEGMKELEVLILKCIHLSLLESSISSLEKLRMLCLEQCRLDKELSIVGKLKKLRMLSFSGSDIEILPLELKQLEKLQIFDISNCFKLKEIPSGVFSSLVRLEELYMRNTIIQWEVEEHTHQGGKPCLSELKCLNQLTTLDIQISNISLLPENLFFDKLHSYKIVVGDSTAYLETHFKMPEKYETLKFLAIRLKDDSDIHSLTGIKMLFKSVENLFLEELNVVQDIFYTLNLKGFPYLKHLLVVNNSTIESLIHPKDRQHPEKAFPTLESLYLYNLQKMKKICSCELSEPSFSKLKVIKINLCGQLENVFSFSVFRLLTLLETIEVSECDSLKNIVPVERQSNTSEVEVLKFPELRFLKLQSLSEFIGFYPIEEKKEVFHEKVEVSKLERMELSSIPIDKIWGDHSLQRSFKKLTHLDVNGCFKLEYLLSYSMAKILSSLQSLFVSECEKMTSIFPLEEQSDQQMKDVPKQDSIFPGLKIIKLCNMKSLSQIWNSKISSLEKLDTLIIEDSDKLVNVFPCYKEGMFQGLCNLRVTNCRSMQAIFDLDDKGDFGRGCLSNLQDVHLEALPKLEYVWKLNEDRGKILNMNNLQKIWVQECHSLGNIFPFSVAIKCLNNLEHLVVCNCHELREIVAKGEASNSESENLDFKFPKLSTVKISVLPNLTSFYPGTCKLSCPALNDLSVELCDLLEPFSKLSSNVQGKFVLFPEEVINKLKSMQIESRHAKSPSSYMGEGNHRRDNLEELCLSRLLDTEILYSFLHRNPNLKSLSLNKCSFKEIVPPQKGTKIEKFGVVPELKTLKLIDLPELKEIRFEPDIILERIEFLILKNCPCLITVVPSSASLTHLTNLEVVNCKELKNLISPSTANSLGQLNTMKVIKCESLREIVGKEGENACKVVFKQLKALELVSLDNLKSFCSSECYDFEFPSLEKLVVSACYNMETFSEKLPSTPILQNVNVVHEKEKKRCFWKDDLNATVHKIFTEKKFFEGMDEVSFSKNPELQEAWQRVDLQQSLFYGLKILKLENCEIQPCAIPCNILLYLKSLKEVEVRDCDNVEVIFDMNVTQSAGIGTTFQLNKLTLQRLPKLTHVWKRIGRATHSFQNLQLVSVGECHKLQAVFPAAEAKNLKKLDNLQIEHCDRLLRIVEKEKDAAVDVTQKFVLPCLTTIYLFDLPKLVSFYPALFTLECRLIKKLYVLHCPKFELFERQSLSLDLNNICNLEDLWLEWKHLKSLMIKSRGGELTGDLQYLNDITLCFLVDESVEPISPIQILQKAPNLTNMTMFQCNCPEIFRNQIPEIDEKRMLTHLKTVTLEQVWKLQSFGSEDSPWLNVICDKLRKFNVSKCNDLTALIAHPTSTVPFSYLKELYTSECNGLEYLFTSSAADKLMHLEHIKVWDCVKLKEIVAKDENETSFRVIKLERVYRIDLNDLESLECFYSGNNTLELPSLIQVDIWKCPKMQMFSPGSIRADSFRGIQASKDSNDELILQDDINTSVKLIFLQQGSEEAQYILENAFGNYGLPNRWLCNLATLKLYKCTLSCAIPSAILPCLKNLGDLEVWDSDKVEVIFDTAIMETMSQLKKLTLKQLSSLMHVWENNSHQVLVFPNLQEVIIDGCENLRTLFPVSQAKNLERLEYLQIFSCGNLREIVKEEQSTEKFVFRSLDSLFLNRLPKLTCFYPKTFTLECPSLSSLCVVDCLQLELFLSAHPTSVGGEGGSTSSFGQPLIQNPKVISMLKYLVLDWKHIGALTSRFQLDKFPQVLKYLEISVLYFNASENEKAMLPIEILRKAPNLMEMTIGYCNAPNILLDQNPESVKESMLGQLNKLTLWNVLDLQSMESENSSLLNRICGKLHELNVDDCPDLTALVHTDTVSFSCLTKVSISNCPQLKYLFKSSAAKRLMMNLKEITVKECESVTEIVAKEENASNEGIKFEQLNTIVLHSLSRLTCFYSGSDTLCLSSLRNVNVLECPNMKIFSQGVLQAERFRGIQMSMDPNENQNVIVHQDLNVAVKHMFERREFLKAVKKYISENFMGSVDLQNIWLYNVKILKLYNCTLSYAIPSAILPSLMNLGELEVRDSDKVEVIFEINDAENAETLSQLKKLTLQKLSGLVHVCENNKHQILVFQNLQEVIVDDCENLQTLFPVSLAKNLERLEKLQIQSCGKLQKIVQKEENSATEKFVFPCLEKLHLYNLPQLTCFYPQTFTLECPSLSSLCVVDCHKFELFQSVHPLGEGEGAGASTSIKRQSLISNLKVIYMLKELKLDWKHIWALTLRFRSEKFPEGLKYLENILLYFHLDQNEKALFPIRILQKAPNLKEMFIGDCNDPKILLAQNPKIVGESILGQLSKLTLRKVSALRSMESEDSSWFNTICRKLLELNVDECPDLRTLIYTDTVSFSCLKKVIISGCPRLQYLFTSSAARKLTNLEEITVKECESVTEIVAKEENASNEGIKLEHLNTIVLHSLSRLTCFYSGNDTLCLSSLINVNVWECPRLKIFSKGECFGGIQRSMDPNENQDVIFHQDLNATVKAMVQQEFFKAVEGDFSEDFMGSVDLQNRWLYNVKILKLYNCTLSYAIPSAILPSLMTLGELEVRDSDKVEVIYDINDTDIMENMSHLKKLTLQQLSSLVHVWENNSHQVLVFPNLEEVIVDGCENLQTLFPAFQAKNLKKLEKLDIKSCDNLQEIVQKEENLAADVTEEFVFPCLQKLYLYNLPQLTCFYPQTFTLECPSLSSLCVSDCNKFELFQSTSINRQPFISNLKVISMLKELKLDWKHIWALTLRFRSEEFPEGLKYLENILLYFDFDKIEKALFPIGILQKAPNLNEMSISYCYYPKILLAQNPEMVEDSMLGQLNKLTLWNVFTLHSMESEDSSWLNTICRKLEELNILECPDLTTLVHTDTVSFSCLKKVFISNCPELQYLFTPSAARKLMNLEEITVIECKSVTGIVAKDSEVVDEDEHKCEGGDKHEKEMIFGKLEFLKLGSLPNFESFYKGSFTLNFLSLKEVWLNQCQSLKIFRLHDKLPVNLKVAIDGYYREGDIHSVIKQQPEEEAT